MAKRPVTKTTRVPRRTQEQRRHDTRNAVLNAAMKILVEDGYEKFTTTRVAKAAGVSRGAQENYFRTKNELIVAATRQPAAVRFGLQREDGVLGRDIARLAF